VGLPTLHIGLDEVEPGQALALSKPVQGHERGDLVQGCAGGLVAEMREAEAQAAVRLDRGVQHRLARRVRQARGDHRDIGKSVPGQGLGQDRAGIGGGLEGIDLAPGRHPGEQLGELAGMGADVDDRGVPGDPRREDRSQMAVMLLGGGLDHMGDPVGALRHGGGPNRGSERRDASESRSAATMRPVGRRRKVSLPTQPALFDPLASVAAPA
jgi:hypothetical protein